MARRATDAASSGDTEELSLLFDISQLLDRSLALEDTLPPMLKVLAQRAGMSSAAVTILQHDSDELHIEAAYGLSKRERERGRYRRGEGIIGRVLESGNALVVPRVSEEPDFLDRTEASARRRGSDTSFVCVPIKLDNRPIGTLSADRAYAGEAVLADDARLLSIVASMLSQAVRLRREAQELSGRLATENARLHEELKEHAARPANITGNSRAMRAVYDLVAQVAPTGTTVLLRGESGTGKELVAHAVHHDSARADKPFVGVNCAALPETVIESELFGHERGAFTGAMARRLGRFELAAGGTIFIDEVGDLSPAVQVRLLRVLQERTFERVGGMETISVDVRVVAATNRNLEQMLEEGTFRQDLYYRLNVFPIHLPPLRERKADILLLADHFVQKVNRASGSEVRRISTPAIDMLMSYHWPGNVRELENCIERACLLSTDGVIHGTDLPPTLQTAEASGTAPTGTLQERLDAVEREMIVETLKLTRGNMARAARQLGLTERIMGLRVRKHGIDYRRFRTGR